MLWKVILDALIFKRRFIAKMFSTLSLSSFYCLFGFRETSTATAKAMSTTAVLQSFSSLGCFDTNRRRTCHNGDMGLKKETGRYNCFPHLAAIFLYISRKWDKIACALRKSFCYIVVAACVALFVQLIGKMTRVDYACDLRWGIWSFLNLITLKVNLYSSLPLLLIL